MQFAVSLCLLMVLNLVHKSHNLISSANLVFNQLASLFKHPAAMTLLASVFFCHLTEVVVKMMCEHVIH